MIFKSPQTHEIIRFVKEQYGDELEFLWQKFPKNAIWRNQINRKWYAALLTVKAQKLGLDRDEEVEIIDLRFDKNEALEFASSHDHIYPGYHMNKNNWITIILDGGLPTNQIEALIDHSYAISVRRK